MNINIKINIKIKKSLDFTRLFFLFYSRFILAHTRLKPLCSLHPIQQTGDQFWAPNHRGPSGREDRAAFQAAADRKKMRQIRAEE